MNRTVIKSRDDKGKDIQFYPKGRAYSPCLETDKYWDSIEAKMPDYYQIETVVTAIGDIPYHKAIFSIYDIDEIFPS